MEGKPSKACRLLFLEPNRGGDGESLVLAIQFFNSNTQMAHKGLHLC